MGLGPRLPVFILNDEQQIILKTTDQGELIFEVPEINNPNRKYIPEVILTSSDSELHIIFAYIQACSMIIRRSAQLKFCSCY